MKEFSVSESFAKTGIASPDMVRSRFPSEERIRTGAVAVIECYMRIACNPCQTACRVGAITIGDDINNIPQIDARKCTGCSICVAKCPGLSIMVVDGSKSDTDIYMRLPYEFLPMPQKGDVVDALDRSGKFVTEAVIREVVCPPAFDRTAVLTISFDKKYMYDIRNIRVKNENAGGAE